ncbi:MAG: HlyD family efflux transporter periplasmic adaptor subunit [Gammaproteobacteria bacterium]|nr:HlyD family efflux transporter periplasmic adaptor subunit [Gammaproteobacteria bacterium]
MSMLYSETLFRKQAITALSKRPFGRPISVMPKPWYWLTGLVVVFAAIAMLFLTTAEYSRKESVRGWLVSRDGVARITHNAAGIVESITVTPGELLQVGDPIIYLSRDTYLEDGRSSGDEIIRELRKQVVAIDRRAELLQAEADIEQGSIAGQLQGLEEEQNALSRQKIEQQRRLGAASEQLTRLRSVLQSGAVTDWEVLSQEDEQFVLKQAWGQLQQSEMTLVRERERLSAKAKSLPIETERSISSLMSQRSQLQQQITRHESERHVVLKSPIAGKLASIEVHRGGAVASNQLLATVLPENLAMVAEVYVPSSAIGFIRPGQRVRIKYDAFPQQQFGTFAGEVDQISDFILMPSEVPQTFFLREATFKVQISIDRDPIDLQAGSLPLRPGMLLAAEIILENRRLLDWLLEPIRLRQRDAV